MKQPDARTGAVEKAASDPLGRAVNLTVKGKDLPEPMATPAPVRAHRPMRDRLAFTYMPDMAAGRL